MSRRVKLPGADELFRPTSQPDDAESSDDLRSAPQQPETGHGDDTAPKKRARGSGRVKHDEKMTIYLTAEELLDIEDARLRLRRSLGQRVDRGRMVREAIALALADLD